MGVGETFHWVQGDGDMRAVSWESLSQTCHTGAHPRSSLPLYIPPFLSVFIFQFNQLTVCLSGFLLLLHLHLPTSNICIDLLISSCLLISVFHILKWLRETFIYETVSWFLWWLQMSSNRRQDPQWTDWYFYVVTTGACDRVQITANSDKTIFFSIQLFCAVTVTLLYSLSMAVSLHLSM